MKLSLLALSALLVGCGSAIPTVEGECDSGMVEDSSSPMAEPRNNDNTDGGLCCQITNNFTNDPFWNNGFYTCTLAGATVQPFDPPWICNTTFDGMCGQDSGLECLTCFDPTCVVGMRCLDVNGTGTVIPCN